MTDENIFRDGGNWFINPMRDLITNIRNHAAYLNLVVGVMDISTKDYVIEFIKERYEKDKLIEIINEAKKEKDSGYQRVLRDGVIILFATLEAGIKHLIKSIFLHAPTMFDDEIIKNFKIPYSLYRQLSEDTLSDIFLSDYEKYFQKDKYGFERFESMLAPVGLSGKIEFDKNVKQTLLELTQVRNLYVHKDGYVDKQFIATCGYLNFQLGERIMIYKEKVSDYTSAVLFYVEEIIIRADNMLQPYLDFVVQRNNGKLDIQ